MKDDFMIDDFNFTDTEDMMFRTTAEDVAQMTVDSLLEQPPHLREAVLIVLAHVAVALNRRVSAVAAKRYDAARDPWRIPAPRLRERLLARMAGATQNIMRRIALRAATTQNAGDMAVPAGKSGENS